MRDIGELYRDSEADNERFRKEISRLKVLCGDTMNQRDSFNTRLADEQADNVRLRAEVKRLTEHVKQEKVNGRRMAERALSNTPQGRAWLAEVDQLRGELAAVTRELETALELVKDPIANTDGALDQRDAALARVAALEEAGDWLANGVANGANGQEIEKLWEERVESGVRRRP